MNTQKLMLEMLASINLGENMPYRVAKSNCLPHFWITRETLYKVLKCLPFSEESFSRTTFHMRLVQLKLEGSKEPFADIEKRLSQLAIGPLH